MTTTSHSAREDQPDITGPATAWRHIQRIHPGEYSGDGSKICAHIKAEL